MLLFWIAYSAEVIWQAKETELLVLYASSWAGNIAKAHPSSPLQTFKK